MNKLLVAAGVVVALVGGAAAALPMVEEYAAGKIKTQLERDGAVKVDTVEVGLLDRRLGLLNLRINRGGELTVGRAEISGLAWPLQELLQGRLPFARFRLGDPLQAGRVEVSNVRFAEPLGGGILTIGALAIEGLDLARFDANVATERDAIALPARLAAALSMTRLQQLKLGYAAARTGAALDVEALSLGRFEQGKFASIAIDNIEGTQTGTRGPVFKIATTKLTGLDLRRVLASISTAGWRPGDPVGRVDLDSVSLSGFSGSALAQNGLSLGSFSAEIVRESAEVRRSRSRIDGLAWAPPLRNLETLQQRVVMEAMGLKEVRLDLSCSGAEDRGKSIVTLDGCVLTGAGLGEISLSATLVQADEPFWQGIDSGDIFAMYGTQAALGDMKLVLADKSLLERSLKAMAATSGQPVSLVRAGLAHEVRRFQPTGVLITEEMTKLLDTVARFVEQGGTLTLTAKPEPPFGLDKFGYFQSPGPDLLGILGVSATLSR